MARVSQAMRDGHNQYAPMTGYLPLKAALVEKVLRLYGQSYDVASEILITASASEGSTPPSPRWCIPATK